MNPLARRTTWSMLKTMSPFHFRPAFLEPTPINTLIFKHSFSFHIFTYRANTLSPVWLPERTLSFSQSQLTESTFSFYIRFPQPTTIKMYTICKHSLPRYTLTMRLFQPRKLKFRQTTKGNKQQKYVINVHRTLLFF